MRCAVHPWTMPHGRSHEALLAAGQGLHVACGASDNSATGCNQYRCYHRHLQVCKLAAQGQRLALPLPHLPPQLLFRRGVTFLQCNTQTA
jgi:hypothetical protein